MLTVIAFFVLACLVLGWIVPLVIGIVRLRRRSTGDTAGMVLTIVGSVWGVVGLMLGVCGGMFWLTLTSFNQVKQFDPSQYDGPMGTIVVPYEGEASLQVTSMTDDGTVMELSAGDGRFQAPVGEYCLWIFTAMKTDEDGSEWEATTFLGLDAPDQITVQADNETSLELGPPFTASIAVTAEVQNEAELELQFADNQGNQYSLSRLDWEEAAPPRFEVRSSSGELVLKGQFEYG